MLIDIFSSFDEQNGNFLNVGLPVWLGSVFVLSLIFSCYWWRGGRFSCFGDLLKSFGNEQILRGRGKLMGGFRGVLSCLLIFLLVANLSGLVPYVFSTTRHLIVTFCLSSVFWLRLLLRSAFFDFGSFLAVLLPVGAPSVLNPFLVLVERVRLFVRPITLSVRLAANMGAGHIVLCLLGSYLRSGFFCYSNVSVLVIGLIGSFYFLFEVGICLIQCYIFFLLINLYADEHC